MSGTPLTHNVFAFIQARTTSTRLPNKVLKPFINNKSILHLLIERVQKVLPKTNIALLVPKGDENLVQFGKENQILVFEGSEQNVRERFIQAAEKWNADWILRLTGDNPFVDVEHLQYLIEATRFTNFDLLSFENLPLGMGGEIFRIEALKKNPQAGVLPEHEEHVSLHIKQYPQEYSVLKLPSLLENSFHLSNIRLTVDEELDFLVCKEIYEEFGNNNFGAKDVLALYEKKPSLFEKNQTVQQVRFLIPQPQSLQQKKILLIYPPLQTHGTGHFRRMTLLKIYLQSLNFQVDMKDISHYDGNDFQYDLCILDARDALIPFSANFAKWIKIDNFSQKQGEETYFYTLPHPQLDFEHYANSFLVPVSYFFTKPNSIRKGILIYVSGVQDDDINYLLNWIVKNFPDQEIKVVGKKISEGSISSFVNLTYFSYYSLMSQVEYFISYFGQSLLEAMHLGCKCMSFSISSYHTELSQFLEEKASVPFLGELSQRNLQLKLHSNIFNAQERFSGFEKLMNLIESKIH